MAVAEPKRRVETVDVKEPAIHECQYIVAARQGCVVTTRTLLSARRITP